MSEVKRYTPGCDYAGQDEMIESADGGYVKWEDYAALKAERDGLAAENAPPVKLPKRHSMLWKPDFREGYKSCMAFRADEVIAAIRAAGCQVEGE